MNSNQKQHLHVRDEALRGDQYKSPTAWQDQAPELFEGMVSLGKRLIMQELVDEIADNVKVDRDVAEGAVGLMLQFLQQNGPKEEIRQFMSAMDGAFDIARRAPVLDDGKQEAPGFFNSMMGMLGMDNRLLVLVVRLQSLGLDTEQAQAVGSHLLAYAKEHVDEGVLQSIKRKMPILQDFT